MSTRRIAREWAVQILFQQDMNEGKIEAVLDFFWKDKEHDPEAQKFTEKLVLGALENLVNIDETIKKHAKHWDISRMGVLDRNVIRMGVYELLYDDEIPAAVSINEAVDIAKYFSNDESGRFVNGVLDHISKEVAL